jgi:2-dehydro-3-deoxygalactonokinase
MRGEEVQLLGAVSAGFVPSHTLLVQPGTHCKWVWIANGQIAGFTTAMTGELFSLLRRHSLLAPQLDAEVTIGSAFLEGVADGKRRDPAAALFQIRAAKLLGRRQDAEAASYASGLLIGSDVGARIDAETSRDFYILADAALGSLYAAALEAHGRRAHFVDSRLAFVAGIKEIAGQWQI